MNKKKLKKARREIDKIDNSIFKLIKKRFIIVKYMLSLKSFKSDIIDHKRINVIFKNIKRKSTQNKVDISVTQKIWKAMIWAFVDYQRRNFKKK